MSGLRPPPPGTGGGGDKGHSSYALPKKNDAGSSSGTGSIERKHLFGTPTSQCSTTTDLSSSRGTSEHRLNVGDVGMSPVRNSVGKLVHLRKEESRFSNDIQRDDSQNSSSDIPIPQLDKEEVTKDEREEEKKESRWNSTRARLGGVLSATTIRESLSRTRRKSVDPKVDHLMNDLNSREFVSRADLEPSPHGSGYQSPPPPNVTAATSLASSTVPLRSEQISLGVPSNTSPSRFSNKLVSWRNHRKERGRSPQDQEDIADSASTGRLRSASSPPSQKFRIRVNRFLRSGKRSASSTTSPTSGAVPAPGSVPENLESSTLIPNAQTPQYLSSAESSTVRGSPKPESSFRKAVRRGVNSARRRMSAPFISTSPSSASRPLPDTTAVNPPERPQTVPLEKAGPLVTPGGSEFILSNEPGHEFLPSEAKVVETSSQPPVIAGNTSAGEWLGRDYEEIPMIQSHPPMFPPGMRESPPLSPWVRAEGGTGEWLELTSAPPRLPEVASIAPIAVDEMMARDFATVKAHSGGQNRPDIYWGLGSGSSVDRIDDGNTTDKGKGKFVPGITDHLKLPDEGDYLESGSGKSIEVLEEEKRRKSRDTGIMGLDPEVRGDLPTIFGPGEEDDDGEFTYASAVREIAGLDRFPKRPPPEGDANLDDVSVPLSECDYDFPLPSFRFSMLAEPSPSSNEVDASPFVASPSPTQDTPDPASGFSRLASTRIQIAPTAATTTPTTTRTTTTGDSATCSTSASFSPPNFDQCHYQMLLSSKRPYMFVLQELSSGTYVKITPQTNPSPVSRSLSTVSQSYPDTPVPSLTSPGSARSPISARFANGNDLLAHDVEVHEEEKEDSENESEGVRGEKNPK